MEEFLRALTLVCLLLGVAGPLGHYGHTETTTIVTAIDTALGTR